jgi:hypothetical protein
MASESGTVATIQGTVALVMPLTRKGHRILRKMKQEYGDTKGEEVFYASEQSGTITGVTADGPKGNSRRRRRRKR